MARSGDLHVIKECPEYTGAAGDHCTIKSSNVDEIGGGSRVVYASAAQDGSLDSDIVLESGAGNSASGHVMLDLAKGTGTITFSGGTGTLRDFHATAAVSADSSGSWHWDGTFNFGSVEAAAGVS